MATIFLTSGDFALVDEEDLETLIETDVPWHPWRHGRNVYARRTINGVSQMMHRLLLPGALVVDHRNGNGLDNRRSNIRAVDHAANARNKRVRIDNKSGFRGVTQRASRKGWRAMITHEGKEHFLGTFEDPVVASAAWIEAAKRLWPAEDFQAWLSRGDHHPVTI